MYQHSAHVIELEEEERLYGWLYMVIKNMFLTRIRLKKNTVQVHHVVLTQEIETDHKKVLADLITESDITYMDRLWITAFLEHNLSATWIQNSINIDRGEAKRRFNLVVKKLQKCTN